MRNFVLAFSLFLVVGCVHADDGIAIMGDSISAGYAPYVEAVMPCVTRIPGNARDSGYTLMHVNDWMVGKHYRVIYWNNGLWDIARRYQPTNPLYDPAHIYKLDPTDLSPVATDVVTYRQNLAAIVAKLQPHLAAGGVIIFATTTDVPDGSIGRKSEDVGTYNSAAALAMGVSGIKIDQLHKFMLPYALEHVDQGGNLVHYTATGRQIAATHVVDTLQAAGGC